MSRRDRTERLLARLSELKTGDFTDEQLTAELEPLLGDKSAYLAARAAELTGQRELDALIPALVERFQERMERPVMRDPNCIAKTATVRALDKLKHRDEAVYRAGIRHVQLEPVFGGKVDTAIELRAASAMALIATGARSAMFELARLMADKEPGARVGAIRALSVASSPAAGPLLYERACQHALDADELYEALSGLLRLHEEWGLERVEQILTRGPVEDAEQAALALGGSRHETALGLLSATLRVRPELERSIYLAAATLRHEEALDFVLAVVREGGSRSAVLAQEALEMHGHDERLAAKLRDALSHRAP